MRAQIFRGCSLEIMIIWRSSRRGDGRRAQRRNQPQDVSEQVARDGNLGHLEGDVATVANDCCAYFAELLTQTRERPLLDRLRRCERAKEVPNIVSQRV
jgi:hypothetical protein